jgi:hypothetical protein
MPSGRSDGVRQKKPFKSGLNSRRDVYVLIGILVVVALAVLGFAEMFAELTRMGGG